MNQGFLYPQSLPSPGMNDTALVLVQGSTQLSNKLLVLIYTILLLLSAMSLSTQLILLVLFSSRQMTF